MTRSHRHRAIDPNPDPRCWTACVAPGQCRPGAHGNITVSLRCRCGAIKVVAVNGRHQETTGWEPRPDDDADLAVFSRPRRIPAE